MTTDINGLIRQARTQFGKLDKETLFSYVSPKLADDDVSLLVAEALWSRSLSISSQGRYYASRAAATAKNTDEDFDFEGDSDSRKFGRFLTPKKPRRPHGQARIETASYVHRIVTNWLNQQQTMGSVTGEKRLAEYTSAEFRTMAQVKRQLSATYAQQASSDDEISKLMENLGCETANELPIESLYRIVKNYRPIIFNDVT